MPTDTRISDSGATLTLRFRATGWGGAADRVELVLDEYEPNGWEFLRCELARDPKRGQRVSAVLTLIRAEEVARLKDERRTTQRDNRG